MKWRDAVLRARALLFRSRAESELDEELRFHLAMEALKQRHGGQDPESAKRDSQIAFGNIESVKEQCRDVRGTRWIENVFRDVRFGLRVLAKERGYSIAAIAAMSVGIGANAALFTVFEAVGLKPLPVAEPARLVSLWRSSAQGPRFGPFSSFDYAYYRDHNSVFTEIAAEAARGLRLSGLPSPAHLATGVAEAVSALFVTENYFGAYAVHPIAGRSFLPDEARLTAGPFPALLSENYWRRRFSGDRGVLGQTIRLSGVPARIVGITPRDFMGTRPYVPDVWIIMAALGDPQRLALDRANPCCVLTARLKAGVTMQQAQADMSLLAGALRGEYPPADRQWRVAAVSATRFGANHGNIVTMFVLLQTAMGLVLLIACANVAGLLLGRAASRQREIAIRLSVGATRGRLVCQLLTEGLLISGVAAVVAFVLNWQTLAAISRAVSTAFASQGGTIAIDVRPDLRVFSYLLSISSLAGVLFALAPALRCTRCDLVPALKNESGAFGAGQRGRLRGLLIAGQIAVCLALLIGAGLLTANSLRLLSVDPGFETRKVLAMTITNPEEIGYPAARRRELQQWLNERLHTIPGVLSVSFASRLPLGGNVTTTTVAPQHDATSPTERQQLPYTRVSRKYFETLGIGIVRGREFSAEEIASNLPVAVVSDALAARFWPNGDAIGKRIVLGLQGEGRNAPASQVVEIIGIARDVASVSFAARDGGAIYLPQPRDDWSRLVLLRVAANQSGLSDGLVREIHAAAPGLPVSAETLQHVIATNEIANVFRIGAMVFGAIGIVGFALASIGVYSMAAYTASRQTREVGIRMALGAQRFEILRLVMAGSLRWIASGLVLGAGLGVILSRILATELLLEAQTFLDPGVILAVSVFTGTLAMVAAYFPARRAARLDPAVTLRFE